MVLLGLTTTLHAAGPNLIIHNARIVTVDPAFSVQQAMAVEGNRIVAVGQDDDVLRLQTEDTELLDLDGKMVLPGLIDSHVHPCDAAMTEFDHPIPEMESVQDVLDYFQARARLLDDGQWIVLQRQVRHQRVAAVRPCGIVGRPASAAEREDAAEPAGHPPSPAERDPGSDVLGGPPDPPRPAMGPGALERKSVAIRVATFVPSIHPTNSRRNRLLTIESKADSSRIQVNHRTAVPTVSRSSWGRGLRHREAGCVTRRASEEWIPAFPPIGSRAGFARE
ncbi:MAG: amidohydrolase family protein [Phycisphaerae bacterium]|nr:amidohydrolase family protein [Phycisphaerae bacterium]